MKLVDTDLLIDRQREWSAGETGPATAYLRQHQGTSFAISTISLLEFLEGYEHPRDGETLLEAYTKLPVTDRIARRGSRLRRRLRAEGQMIGDFDVLIAATALDAGIPLVTGNLAHFQRVPELEVESYRETAEIQQRTIREEAPSGQSPPASSRASSAMRWEKPTSLS